MQAAKVPRVLLAAAILLLSAFHAHSASAETTIHNTRLGITAERTRLVFDASGDRPSRVLPSTKEGIVIEFAGSIHGDGLSKLNLQPSTGLGGIGFKNNDGGSRIVVSPRNPNSAVKHEILPSKNGTAGHYRLVLDIFPGVKSKEEQDKETGGLAPAPENAATRVDPAETVRKSKSDKTGKSEKPLPQPVMASPDKGKPDMFDSPVKEAAQGKSHTDRKGTGKGSSAPPESQGSQPPDPEKSAALYDKADSFFDAHQQDLVHQGSQILEVYLEALRTDPKSPRAFMAFYRSGLVHQAMGNLKKAEKHFQQVIAAGQSHALFAKSWLRLGEIYHQEESYVEAIDAFRFALRSHLEREDRLLANYQLGRDLILVGAAREGMEALQQCMNEDTTYFLKKPDIIKFLGESHFALKQFDAGKALLIRYLNLAQDAPGQDMVLAKVAEIYLNLGDQTLANKVYSYIQRHHKDSEGDIISKIRNAEMLETRERGNIGPALSIYRDLSKKDLSPPLRRLVFFKLASLEFRHGSYPKSMELIEEILADKKDATSQEEFIALRERVLGEWVTKCSSEKDHLQLIQLHERHGPAFRTLQSPDIEVLIAEAYAVLGFYPNAMQIYERLLTNSRKRNEDWLMKIALYSFLSGDSDKALHLCGDIQSSKLETQKTALLGRILASQKKYGEAVKHFSKIVHKDKDLGGLEPGVLEAYAEGLMGLDKFDEALQLLVKARESFREGPGERALPLLLLQSKCHQELKQLDKGIEVLEAALKLAASDEQKSQLNYELSKVYLAAGKTEKASQMLTQLLQTSQSFWKTAAQQQLESIKMAKPK